MKGVLPQAKMKPGIAKKGTATKPMRSPGPGKYANGGRVSPLADTASKNPMAYGAK